MAQRYADEVRRDRKTADRSLKELVNKRVQKKKDRLKWHSLLIEIETIGQRGNSIDPVRLRSNIAQLGKEISDLGVEIDNQRKIYEAFNDELKMAPKRPKTRSQAASIAASGVRAINAAANRRPKPWSAKIAWENGIAAATTTADKYKKPIPGESIAIMESRLIEHYPRAQFEQTAGLYPTVRGSVVSK
jgi:hypothetical protein